MSNKNRKDYHFFLDANNPLQRSAMEQIELCKEIMGCTTKAAIVTLLCNKNIIIQDKNDLVTNSLEKASPLAIKPVEMVSETPKPKAIISDNKKESATSSLNANEPKPEPKEKIESEKELSSVDKRLKSLLSGYQA